MLEIVVDLALLLVSGSACLYCWLLSRRLRALQDLKKGLGASIVSLSEAISKTSVAAQEAKLSAAQSADKLTRLLSDIDKSVPLVDDLIESVQRSTRRAANETTRMQEDAVAAVRPMLDEARKTATELAEVLERVNQRTERLQASYRELESRTGTPCSGTGEETGKPGTDKSAPGIASLKMNYRLDEDAVADAPGPHSATIATIDTDRADNGNADDDSTDGPGRENPFTTHISRLQALAAARREHDAARRPADTPSEPDGTADDETTDDKHDSDRTIGRSKSA